MIDRALALRIMLLLSALESWSFSVQSRTLPDHTHQELSDLQDIMRAIVLEKIDV